MTSSIALITGITGQDGSYLAELLLEKGYEVHGVVRRTSNLARSRIDHLTRNPDVYGKRFFLHYGDLLDATTLRRIFKKVRPTEVYHLAGQSHVGLSFEIPESTCEEVAVATLRLLEICRDLPDPVKIYHASSSEVFGSALESPQTEETPFRPTSPYGCAKAFATNAARVYREAYGIFVCNGILYNHESPRRGENFVTRKISNGVARIKLGFESQLVLGNTSAERDWGHAKDYVRAMWMMLQHSQPDDYVVASGQVRSVMEFVQEAFGSVDLPWEKCLATDASFERRSEPLRLVGNPAKIQRVLGWQPNYSFKELVKEMVQADLVLSARPHQAGT